MNRPYVICHMMMSTDGRIVIDNWTTPSGNEKNDLVKNYSLIHKEVVAEAIIEGRKTVQGDFVQTFFEYNKYPPAKDFKTHIATQASARYFVVVDPQGKIKYEENKIRGNDIICVLGEQVSDEYLTHLKEKGISYLFAGTEGRDMDKALQTLKEVLGIETLLLQGGGLINGSFLKAGLIDELSLMIYPGIDGLAGTPALFDYPDENEKGILKKQSLKLLSCKVLDNDVIWIKYKLLLHE